MITSLEIPAILVKNSTLNVKFANATITVPTLFATIPPVSIIQTWRFELPLQWHVNIANFLDWIFVFKTCKKDQIKNNKTNKISSIYSWEMIFFNVHYTH